MKRKVTGFLGLLVILSSCEERTEKPENSRGIPGPEKVDAIAPHTRYNQTSRADELKDEGYEVFTYEEGDSTYLMQQYYMVFLKEGKVRSQDTVEIAELQKQHMAHLNRMAEEGYASLMGPFADDGEIRGVVVFNTRTAEEADSLAKLDPMVRAGRLEVEVHPWWASKGERLR